MRLATSMLAFALIGCVTESAEQLDTSFHSIDDLRSFVRVPTLFSIPLITTAADARRQWRRFALTTVVAVIGLGLIAAGVRHVATGNERIVRMVSRGHA